MNTDEIFEKVAASEQETSDYILGLIRLQIWSRINFSTFSTERVLPRPKKEVMFLLLFIFCLSICEQDYPKRCGPIFTKFYW